MDNDDLTTVWLDDPAEGGGGAGADAGVTAPSATAPNSPGAVEQHDGGQAASTGTAQQRRAVGSPSSAPAPRRTYSARRLDMLCLDSLSANPDKAFYNDRVAGDISGVGERVVEASLMRILQRQKLTVKLAQMFYRAARADGHKKVASFIEGLDLFAAMRGATSAPPGSTMGNSCHR